MTGHRINWRPRELTWIKRRRKWERRELHAAFVKKFRRHRDVPFGTFKSLCTRAGILTGRQSGRAPGHLLVYTRAELTWIQRRQTMPRRGLHAMFIAAFPHRTVSLNAFKALCSVKGFRTGRDGRLVKGNVPANKGKKMPFNANSARTQFQKGALNGRAAEVYKPIGSERFSKEGYLERKIHEGLPTQSRWRGVHIINWEKLKGPVPKHHCLKCLDGDRLNTDPSNWELISRAVLARLNKSRNRYDTAPAELRPAIMAIAKLRDRIGEKGKRR